MKNEFAEIVFPVPIDHAFTYRVPRELRGTLKIGHRVLASFGRRRLTGFVARITGSSALTELKEIDDILDPEPLFSEELLQLCQWIADYYICPFGEVLKAALPAGIHRESKLTARLRAPVSDDVLVELEGKSPRQAELLRALVKKTPQTVEQLKRRVGSSSLRFCLSALAEKGIIELDETVPEALVKPRIEKHVRLSPTWTSDRAHELQAELSKRAPKQAECLRLLLEKPGSTIRQADLLKQAQASSQALNGLQKLGVVEVIEQQVWRDYYGQVPIQEPKSLKLTQEQERAFREISEGIDSGGFQTYMLHGVTGSGKTQVYIEAIRHALDKDKDAIVLVPEISLTPQIVARFRSYFRDQVTVLHSRMSPGERYDSWRKTRDGLHRIVIGPRSAVFAPVRNLGLVVVDEEQESTFKQEDIAPRYHGRDVAIMRAKLSNAVAVLGTATPSMESYYNAKSGKYRLLELTHRIDHVPMPEVVITDMTEERKAVGFRKPLVFSRLLQSKIEEKLGRGEQIILLQNRRGYSTFIKCRDCGHIEECRNCNVTLTFHAYDRRLRCHYCNYVKRAPDVCPKCGGADILFRGTGTQKVEEEVKRLFPDARLVRMDLDTTKGKRAHDRILQSFEHGEFDILLGTQMVAKGLDFQRVSLVGVISADTGLFFPDFRASEQTFQLLTQVAGRSGRVDKRGEVVIQTYSPDHYCLQFSRKHDFLGFYKKEIVDRETLRYPPFGRLAVICFRSIKEENAARAAKAFLAALPTQGQPFQSYGPLPAPLVRLQRNYRWQIVLKELKSGDPGGKRMNVAIRRALAQCDKRHTDKRVRLTVDVDPMWML